MAPRRLSKPAAKPAVPARQRRTELKIPVLSIRGPYSAEVLRPSQQANASSERFSVRRSPAPISNPEMTETGSKHVSHNSVPQTSQDGPCLSSVSTRTGSPKSWYQSGGMFDSPLKQALMVKPVYYHTRKKSKHLKAAPKK
ncbi:uncharacterized protein ACNS7B_003871 isoform 1-T1 [Menidia menidia]